MKFIVKSHRTDNRLSGFLRVPGDKSISHRAIILGSLANGTTNISGFLQGKDSLATIKAFQDLGVKITNKNNIIVITGVGMQGLRASKNSLDLGNSGTAMRLLTGLLAGQKFNSVLVGDESLSTRPMERIIKPLSKMSAIIKSTKKGTAPLKMIGSNLTAIDYQMPIASAQLKSAILLAGMYSNEITCVHEPAKSRDHTERMLQGFGYPVTVNDDKICIKGGGTLTATDIDVPADISSAAFFIVAASISKNSELTLSHIGINPTRTGVIDILKLMGADITIQNKTIIGGEPVADILVKSAELKGIVIPKYLVPLAIDEFPIIFIAAAAAEGQTVLTNAKELKVKESDRITAMSDGMNILNIDATATEDGIIINGGKPVSGGTVDSHGDHRVAMSFAICSQISTDDIIIENCDNVNTSYPNFVEDANSVGFNIISL